MMFMVLACVTSEGLIDTDAVPTSFPEACDAVDGPMVLDAESAWRIANPVGAFGIPQWTLVTANVMYAAVQHAWFYPVQTCIFYTPFGFEADCRGEWVLSGHADRRPMGAGESVIIDLVSSNDAIGSSGSVHGTWGYDWQEPIADVVGDLTWSTADDPGTFSVKAAGDVVSAAATATEGALYTGSVHVDDAAGFPNGGACFAVIAGATGDHALASVRADALWELQRTGDCVTAWRDGALVQSCE